MNLQENINKDLKQAQQEKNELVILVLRTVNSEIHNKEIEKKASSYAKASEDKEEVTEEDIVDILMSETKKRKEAIEEFRKGNRQDLAEKEKKELEILKKYLPEQMGEEQIREEAKKAIEEAGATGPQDTGKVMSILMPKLKGKAEGGVVSKIVGELLKND
jgi:uncharacterized protein YqeY